MTQHTSLPVDSDSRDMLAAHGLDLGILDPTDLVSARRWLQAEARGFHDSAHSNELLGVLEREIAIDRVTAVHDRSGADPDSPVATVRSWEMGLSVPGGGTLPAWAISSVTVAPTHRRRGIARALLPGELRSAQALGLPLAMLTVSEATIYGRFGFGPAAHQAHVHVDTTRARWIGPVPTGRVDFVTAASLVVEGPAIFERSRESGEVDRRPSWWSHALGLVPQDPDSGKRSLRCVRYDDAAGRAQGFAVYSIALGDDGYPARLDLADLVAATDDAYAALWHFVIDMDLVTEVSAPLRSVREALSWQVSDRRAVRKTLERDHLWLRILDVPTALSSRTYSAPGIFRLTVTDDLDFAAGDYLLTVDADGHGAAHPLAGEMPADAVHVTLAVADLGALYLGAGSAVDLARAGRLTTTTTDAAARLDATFHSPTCPRLSTGF
ncbi:GNAT family N-acetyltransferase [Cryobacterium psychrophilum]|uniref:GNAT family N-acetyltransferase n=1 Tax=Cryobacterium psychrophilum TaxID=41988 RepID=A0A4Y8KJN0_9MICO|nr:GNAT family N-acetyltransferase [Cryobacterium psychrophilum]TDW30512.1 putative acetyltransferase [Cryobacterium psychrophilum]TFD76316.1 GNAT family N-acetyltransferase [Cryobacterium psychrophilum]